MGMHLSSTVSTTPMNKPLLIGIIVVVIVLIALASYLTLIHHSSAIIINAPYAFIIQLGNGSWVVEYFDAQGNLHMLGPFNNLNDPDIVQAMSVVDSFNQQVVPQHSSYQPLDSIIVVGAGDAGKQGVVEIPVSGNTIELNQVNPGYYTLVAVPQQYTTQFMQALDVGYKLSAGVGANGLQYLQYNNPQVWKLVLETNVLQHYSSGFIGEGIIETNNSTLIPWSFWSGYNSQAYGSNLQFIIQSSTTFYNGQ